MRGRKGYYEAQVSGGGRGATCGRDALPHTHIEVVRVHVKVF